MCGIIGVTGAADVTDILLDGLSRLEYRGYDSAGVVIQTAEGLWRARVADGTNSLEGLRKLVGVDPPTATSGLGHTRWATHGHPTEHNAHPLLDCHGRVAVIHNGIIENYRPLIDELRGRGHRFDSETDTELIAHLLEENLAEGASLAEALRTTINRLRGSFAIAAMSASEPGTIVATRRVSPLIVGLGESDEAGSSGDAPPGYLASDVPALLGRTRRLWALEDDQLVEIRPGSVSFTDLHGDPAEPTPLEITWDLEAAQKGGFPDFMSKEIHEQPRAVADTLLGRLIPGSTLALDESRIPDSDLSAVDKVFIVACGSSFHAGLVAKYAIEHWSRLPTEIDIASEFRYRDPVLDERTLVVGVSQSGETVDTLQAMRHAKAGGAKVLVVSNVVDSSMAREADGALYTRAGPEICVASTKTHLAQIVALELLALHLAGLRGSMSADDARIHVDELSLLPSLIEETIGRDSDVERVAAKFTDTQDFFFLGRHVGYPVAMEGALKLKEISYARAEAYPAGELKHGPISLIVPGAVVVGVATRTSLWEKMMGNIAEVKARGATVVLVANDGDEETAEMADEVLWVPPTQPLLAPVVDVVPLQLFAYHVARARGHDVDRPRNLAKTVTVE